MTNLDEPSPFAQHSVKRMMCIVTSKYARLFKISTLGLLLGVFYFAQTGGMVQAGDKESLTEAESLYNLCVLKDDLESVIADDIGLMTPPHIHAQEKCLPQEEQKQINEQELFQQELELLLADHPMEEMAESIALHDRTVAALLVGIAKKESNWGKHSPSKGGEDCYNYWGYKTSGSRGQSMGYACFGSVEEAVDVTGSRISHFVHEKNRDTPAKMIVWKCGSSCATHTPESVSKWIADVQMYYNKVLAIETTERDPQTILTLR